MKLKLANSTTEDYLERIHGFVEAKGYARVSEIAASLDVSSAAVTLMIRKLTKQGYVSHEKYGGVVLTQAGRTLGRAVGGRHRELEEFLRLLGVTDEKTIWHDVEGIEHHVSPATMKAIRAHLKFFAERPETLEDLIASRGRKRIAAAKTRASGRRGADGAR